MNEYYITVSYADGTSVTSGIDFTEKDGEIYFVERNDLPGFWNYITRRINKTGIDIIDYVCDIFDSGSSVSMSADAMDRKSYETYNINDKSYLKTIINTIDEFEYTKIIKPDAGDRIFSITITSADGTKAMSFWKGEQDIVMYDDGKSIQYWSAALKKDNSTPWLTTANRIP